MSVDTALVGPARGDSQGIREANLTLDVRAGDGSAAGSVDLPVEVFGTQTNIPLIHQVVVAQLAAARQGTHSTKTRGEVSGGGKKPYRQKGTGRARQGSTRAPQFAGGGVVHGPRPRDYEQRTPKKMKAAALRGALSDRARHGRIHVVAELGIDGVPSTRAASRVLAGIATRRNLLLIVSRTEQATQKSVRNIPDLHVLWPDQLNPYDVLCSDEIVFTRTALDEFVARASVGVSRGRFKAIQSSQRSPEQVLAEPTSQSRTGATAVAVEEEAS